MTNSLRTSVRNFIQSKTNSIPSTSRILIFIKLMDNHKLSYDKIFEMYSKYGILTSNYEKTELMYGSGAADKLKNKLKSRKRPTRNNSWFKPEYWIEKYSLSYEEAVIRVSKIQAENNKKRKGYFRHQHPSNIEYYMKMGHNKETAIVLTKEYNKTIYISNVKNLPEAEYNKFKLRYKVRSNNMIEKYGTSVISSNVSKESLRFFIKLYKKLRRHGFEKSDIRWGIQGSREFGTRYENNNYLYDFCVLSKKIIIEYNGIFWHYRKDLEWKNPFITIEESENKSILKSAVVRKLGYNLFIVWSDENLQTKINELFEEIIK